MNGLRHELRTPLTQILGYSELLIEEARGPEAEPLVADLRKIHAAAEQLLSLIDTHLSAPLPSEDAGLEAAPIAPATAPTEPRRPLPAIESDQPGLILIADDDAANRDLLSRRLQQHGYRVAEAVGGVEALARLEAEPFDLVLLDIMMPEMDGIQVLERLKENGRLPHLPVIMISALDEVDSVVRCLQLGAEDYLTKPFNPVLLHARVGASLEKKRLRDNEQRLFQELQQNYQRLQELERLRDDLTDMIVHDMRTPLTSLLTGLQTMSLVGTLEGPQQRLLTLAIRGGKTLLSLINDMLDVSKAEAGALVLDREAIAPAELLAAAVEQVAPLVEQKRLCLMPAIDPALPPLHGDRDKLCRTLVNLLANAIRFTPEDGQITVTVEQQASGVGRQALSEADRPDQSDPPDARRLTPHAVADMVRFAVEDTGEGVPPEAVGRIWEKFGQARSRQSGSKLSTGLGLTFCRMIVEAHGGAIGVDSEVGRGSTFWFLLPLSERDEP